MVVVCTLEHSHMNGVYSWRCRRRQLGGRWRQQQGGGRGQEARGNGAVVCSRRKGESAKDYVVSDLTYDQFLLAHHVFPAYTYKINFVAPSRPLNLMFLYLFDFGGQNPVTS